MLDFDQFKKDLETIETKKLDYVKASQDAQKVYELSKMQDNQVERFRYLAKAKEMMEALKPMRDELDRLLNEAMRKLIA